MRTLVILCLLLIGFAGAIQAASVKAALPPTRLQNALTDPQFYHQPEAPDYVRISLADAPPENWDRPDGVDRRPPPSKSQGIAFLIAGSICLAGGAALLAYGIQQRNQNEPRYTDLGSLLAITGGALLGIVGLSLTIPGIVFVASY